MVTWGTTMAMATPLILNGFPRGRLLDLPRKRCALRNSLEKNTKAQQQVLLHPMHGASTVTGPMFELDLNDFGEHIGNVHKSLEVFGCGPTCCMATHKNQDKFTPVRVERVTHPIPFKGFSRKPTLGLHSGPIAKYVCPHPFRATKELTRQGSTTMTNQQPQSSCENASHFPPARLKQT